MDPQEPLSGSEGHVDEKLRKLVRWAQHHPQLGRDPLPAVADDGGGSGASVWAGVASAFEQFALDASGVPGADSAVAVLRAIYGVEDAQSAMLSTIDRNVRLLREGPFKTGRLLVTEAARVGPGDDEYRGFLNDARTHFYDAHELVASIQERALVEFHLGSVYALEDRRPDAAHWFEQSHESAAQVMVELGSTADNVKVLHSRKTTAALTYLYPAGVFVVPAKLKKVWTAERASCALEAFLPFVNSVARSYNTLAPSSQLAPMELRREPDGSITLDTGTAPGTETAPPVTTSASPDPIPSAPPS